MKSDIDPAADQPNFQSRFIVYVDTAHKCSYGNTLWDPSLHSKLYLHVMRFMMTVPNSEIVRRIFVMSQV